MNSSTIQLGRNVRIGDVPDWIHSRRGVRIINPRTGSVAMQLPYFDEDASDLFLDFIKNHTYTSEWDGGLSIEGWLFEPGEWLYIFPDGSIGREEDNAERDASLDIERIERLRHDKYGEEWWGDWDEVRDEAIHVVKALRARGIHAATDRGKGSISFKFDIIGCQFSISIFDDPISLLFVAKQGPEKHEFLEQGGFDENLLDRLLLGVMPELTKKISGPCTDHINTLK